MAQVQTAEETRREAAGGRMLWLLALVLVLIGVGLTAAMGLAGLAVFGLIGTFLTMAVILIFAVGG
ncbi:hypothetical protein ACEYYB_14170 [Paracoccus sp. p4-l81]|uniref:hypothetical protein n=1 Tax=unclassified Paracoccus (in: a-proteobacteria) TaxID=2688777 RepID=UPI0035B76919